MKKNLALLLFLGILTITVNSQSFVIKDVLISDPYSQISDIELDPYNPRICWQSPENELWICKLDTSTWVLEVPDGKQTLVDSGLTSMSITANAGEWGFDQNGTFIVYPKTINKISYIALAGEYNSIWTPTVFMDAPYRINPHATRNPLDSFAAINYVRFNFSVNTKYKFLDDPYNEMAVACFSDAHWAADEQLLTGIIYNDQVALYDPHNPGLPIPLTLGMKTKYARPYMWRAPEHNNARMFFAVANEEQIRVFKEITPYSNIYKLYMYFSSPSSNPAYQKIASPEPIVFQGQSYISFMASTSPFEKDAVPSEIWLAKIDSLNPLFRMVSDTSHAIRTDPEPFPAHDSLLVFYTEVDKTSLSYWVYRTHRCETGIGGNGVITGQSQPVPPGRNEVEVYPNPFTGRIALKNPRGDEYYILNNTEGKRIWEGKNLSRADFSSLSPGVYFLSVNSRYEVRTARLIKQ